MPTISQFYTLSESLDNTIFNDNIFLTSDFAEVAQTARKAIADCEPVESALSQLNFFQESSVERR